VSDAELWQRNWAWCDPRTGVCAGAVSKRDWLDPRTRGPACRAVISNEARHASSTVHFCLIDGGTERLCQLVLEWNAEITVILYRAAPTLGPLVRRCRRRVPHGPVAAHGRTRAQPVGRAAALRRERR